MATRKKKSDPIGNAKIILPETRIVKESHLTITYDANNYPVKLEWDDEALMNDVRAALLNAESSIPATLETKPKKKTSAVTATKKKKTK